MTRDLTKAIEIIKRFEGICDGDPSTVNLDPYLCPAGYWTIGWGHVVRDSIGRMVKGQEKKMVAKSIYPKGITIGDAERLLASDVRIFAMAIEEMLRREVNNDQFCALVSFAFNVGLGAFERSTLLRLLNNGDYEAVPAQLMRWTKVSGKESNGLRRRRQSESALWMEG